MRLQRSMFPSSKCGSDSLKSTLRSASYSSMTAAYWSVRSCLLSADWSALRGTGSGLLGRRLEEIHQVVEAKTHLEGTETDGLTLSGSVTALHLDTEAPPPLTCWAVLFPRWADTCLNVFLLAPLCWQAVKMARSASLKQTMLLYMFCFMMDSGAVRLTSVCVCVCVCLFWPGPDDDFFPGGAHRDVFSTNWSFLLLSVTSCLTLSRRLMIDSPHGFVAVPGNWLHLCLLRAGYCGRWIKLLEALLQVRVMLEERRDLKEENTIRQTRFFRYSSNWKSLSSPLSSHVYVLWELQCLSNRKHLSSFRGSKVIIYLVHVLKWWGWTSLQHWHHLLVERWALTQTLPQLP